jgi:DNA polymerase III epsilon subunit family exonuclease
MLPDDTHELSHLTFVSLDTETTGLSPRSAELVEVAAVRFRLDGQVLGRFEQLIDPCCDIPHAATAVHGITSDMVAGQPTIREVLPSFFRFIEQADVLLIHNASFDLGFLREAARRTTMRYPELPIFCTLALARKRIPELSSHRLDLLVSRFLGRSRADHRALGDAESLRHLFAMMVQRSPEMKLYRDLLTCARARGFLASTRKVRRYVQDG